MHVVNESNIGKDKRMARKGKNRHGLGGVIHRGKNNYQVHFTIIDPETNRAKRKFFRVNAETQRDALAQKRKLEEQYKRDYGRNTVSDLAQQWLKMKKNLLATFTHDRYVSAMDTIWLPELGRKQISKITDQDIERVLEDYANSNKGQGGSKPKEWTVHGQYRVFRTFLNWCVKKKHIPFSPHETADIAPVSGEYEIRTVPKEWVDKLIDACQNHEEKTLIMLYCYAGLRLSEAFGIQMTDVDYDNNQIRIHQQSPKGKLTDLKAHNKKTIGLPQEVLELLKKQELNMYA